MNLVAIGILVIVILVVVQIGVSRQLGGVSRELHLAWLTSRVSEDHEEDQEGDERADRPKKIYLKNLIVLIMNFIR
jgi:hypothetical protein